MGGYGRRSGAMIAFLVGVVAVSVGADGPGSVGRSLDPPAGVLVASGPAPTLTFAYSGDVIGYIDPCG